MRLRKQHNIKYKIKLNYKTVLIKFIKTEKKKKSVWDTIKKKKKKKKIQENSNTKTD